MKSAAEMKKLPELNWDQWRDTALTLQLWTQVVGKVRLAQTPWLNHGWHVPLYVTARGLGTGVIPHDAGAFELEFDLLAHRLHCRTDDGFDQGFPLVPMPVADFFVQTMALLDRAGRATRIHVLPNEVPDPVPLDQDRQHRSYDADAVASGGRFSSRTLPSNASAPVSLAKPARSISSGAASISP